MKTITIKLPEALEEQVAHEAQRQGVSKSSLVREALVIYLGTETGNESALDLIRDLVGTVDAPSDLSTNPKYFEDFGEDSMGSSGSTK